MGADNLSFYRSSLQAALFSISNFFNKPYNRPLSVLNSVLNFLVCSFASCLLPSFVLFIPSSLSSSPIYTPFFFPSIPCPFCFSPLFFIPWLSYSSPLLSLSYSPPPFLNFFPPYFSLHHLPPSLFTPLSPSSSSSHRRRWTLGQRCHLCSIAWPTTPT